MKIRNGFVSNSSSSSFVIMGAIIDSGKNTEQKIMEMMGYEDYESDLAEYKERYYSDIELDEEIISEFFYEKFVPDYLDPEGYILIYECGHIKGKQVLFGKHVAEVGDYGTMSTSSYSAKDLEKLSKELQEVVGHDVEIKLYCGTYPC